ncbi:IS3 family transposase [Arthrobacter sp. Marseille-P9274]|uniref:IS3 family transposase n=1 Tax=Arthrobacter sp. Marseille-P9274 TaxID=2866572 RepID=UPI0021C7E370|nr:IS3 family transposase [Arthrobacter sp. Marseille-P9274]
MKVQAIIALKADFSLPVLLQVAGLARSTFFYHQARLRAPDPKEAVKSAATTIFTKNHGRYGQKWVTDVTEFRVDGRKLYLSPVMDLFDRQILSYTVGLSPNLALTNTSLRMALATLEYGQKPIVHSDQGFQYQHASWRRLLQGANAIQSMSRKGNCYDNAVMENFFGHLKEELFHHVRFLSTGALTSAIHEYIRWYNTERISTKLEGLSPVQYRAQALKV